MDIRIRKYREDVYLNSIIPVLFTFCHVDISTFSFVYFNSRSMHALKLAI